MADGVTPATRLLLLLNLSMHIVLLAISAWAVNRAIDQGFLIGPGLKLPAHFSPVFFPMGNAATGFFIIFSLLAGVVGVASAVSGVNHIRGSSSSETLPAAVSGAATALSLTLLAMGFAWKEIELNVRNSRLKTMEAFVIILSATQLLYIISIYAVNGSGIFGSAL